MWIVNPQQSSQKHMDGWSLQKIVESYRRAILLPKPTQKVFLLLESSGNPMHIDHVAKLLKMHRNRVYEALEQLKKNNLAGQINGYWYALR